MKAFKRAFSCLLFLLSAGLSSQGAPAPSWPDSLSFGLFDSGYSYDSATDRGIDKDIALELGRRLGLKIQFVQLSWSRIWSDLASGKVAMTGSARQTPDREEIVRFVPYMLSVNRVVRLSGSPESPEGFLASSGAIWGGLRGARYESEEEGFLGKLEETGRLDLCPDFENLFSLMKKGRITATFSLPPSYGYYLDKLGLRGSVTVEDWFPAVKRSWACLALSRKALGEAEWAAAGRAVSEMRTDGTLRRIFAAYLGAEADRLALPPPGAPLKESP